MKTLLRVLLGAMLLEATATLAAARVEPPPGALLPAGYLSTIGSQIVDAASRPVRIVAVGWPGGDGDAYAPYGLFAVNYQRTMDDMKAAGFNTIRLPYCDGWVGENAATMPLNNATYTSINYQLNPDLRGLTALQVTDKIVAYAGRIGLRIIIDHHNNACGGGQQRNGLWYDATTSVARFEANWVAWARRYKGNPTVIGYDLDNEPANAATWGGGGRNDWRAEATRLGNLIQAVEPGVLIIVEGPQNWSSTTDLPLRGPEGNLSEVRARPVVLSVPHKLVYSVHEYPPSIADIGVNREPEALVAHMNRVWGDVVAQNIAPVWVGEMGSSLRTQVDRAWAQVMVPYLNGKLGAEGGPTFSGDQQGIGIDWWWWGSEDNWDLNGYLAKWDGTPRPDQQAVVGQLLMRPLKDAPPNRPPTN